MVNAATALGDTEMTLPEGAEGAEGAPRPEVPSFPPTIRAGFKGALRQFFIRSR